MDSPNTPEEIEQTLAFLKKSNLGYTYPTEEALDRARRMLTGEITHEEALAELEKKWPRLADY